MRAHQPRAREPCVHERAVEGRDAKEERVDTFCKWVQERVEESVEETHQRWE